MGIRITLEFEIESEGPPGDVVAVMQRMIDDGIFQVQIDEHDVAGYAPMTVKSTRIAAVEPVYLDGHRDGGGTPE